MRQLSTLALRSFFTLLVFATFSTALYPQNWPDPDTNLTDEFPDAVVECDNEDLANMENSIWDLIANDDLEIFESDGGCEHDIIAIVPDFDDPYSCTAGIGGGATEIEVEFEYTNCVTGATEMVVYFLDITDTTPPFDNSGGNCSYDGPFNCEGNTEDGDPTVQEIFDEWVQDIVDNVDECFGDNCTAFEDLDIQVDPGTLPSLMDGSTCYDGEQYTITFIVTDECGNPEEFDLEFEIEDGSADLSAPEVVEDLDGNSIPFCMSWTDEIFGGPVCPDMLSFADAPVLIVSDVCQGTWTVTVDEDLSDNPDDWECSDGTGIWYYEIIDECGNEHEANPWEIKWDLEPEDDLEWDDMSDFPQEGDCIEYSVNNTACFGEFINPDSGACDGPWVSLDEDGEATLFASILTLDQVTGGCEPYMVEYSHLPCEFLVEQLDLTELVDHSEDEALETMVVYTVTDACGEVITWEFKVTYQCGSCGPRGNIACEFCSETEDPGSPCYLCDPEELANGYESCTPPCADPSCPVIGGNLCAGGVPHNMSWFAFQASAEDLEVCVEVENCTAGPSGLLGVQAGVYEVCDDWGNCIGGFDNCTTTGEDFGLSGLTVGAVYYMWVDGCAGSECEYTIQVKGIEEILLDTPDAIRVRRECDTNDCLSCDGGEPDWDSPESDNCGEAQEVHVCPGECLIFEPIHNGENGFFPNYDNPCDTYSPEAFAVFFWRWWDGDAEINPQDNGGDFMEPLCAPEDPGSYELCLDGIFTECTSFDAYSTCVTIIVDELTEEPNYYAVCIEDLDATGDNYGPWDPADTNDEFNGYDWFAESISLEDMEDSDWEEDDDDERYLCKTFFAETDCPACLIPQRICIDVIGDMDKTDITLFMYECQFLDCELDEGIDCSDEEYEWVWDWGDGPPQDFPLLPTTIEECIRVEEYHPDVEDWGQNSNCDTIPQVTVVTAPLPILIDTGGCSAVGTKYTVEIDFETLEDDFKEWPPIFPTYAVEFLDCRNGNRLGGSSGNLGQCLTVGETTSNICINVIYSFSDGAWWNSDDEITTHPDGADVQCNTFFGPFEWGEGEAVVPRIQGDNLFCDTDVLGHTFSVTNYLAPTVITWSSTDGATFPNGNTGLTVDVDFPVGQTQVCIQAIADTDCGLSDAGEFCIDFIASPSVSLAAMDDICRTDGPDINATVTATAMATVTPPGDYTYSWFDNGLSVGSTTTNTNSFSYPVAGTHDITVMVVDNNDPMCESLISAAQSFEVIEPLEPPVINCGQRGQDFVEFTWSEVDGATGYLISIDSGPFEQAVGTSHIVDNLVLNQTVNIQVIAEGLDPCLNSATVNLDCMTTDCPPSGVVNNHVPLSYCSNDQTLGTEDLNAGFDLAGAESGDFTWSITPSGDATGGMVDLASLAAGTYTVGADYIFGATSGCSDPFSITITITDPPVADFSITPMICETDGAVVTLMNTGSVVNTDYGDPSATVNADGSVSYPGPGVYTVTLEVTDQGCDNSSTQQVEVLAALDAAVIECTDTGIDYVSISWGAVEGAATYDLSITIDGVTTTQTGLTDTDYTESPLIEGQTVTFVVTANPDTAAGYCSPSTSNPEDCTANPCDIFPTPNVDCVIGTDNIEFTWGSIIGIDSFLVVVDGVEIRTDELSYTVDGLGELDEVTITVQPIHPDPQCPTNTGTETCQIPCEDLPMMGPVTCGDADLDFVTFEWEAVTDVDQYEISYTLDGVDIIDTITATSLVIDGLQQDQQVTLSVTALNPNVDCGNGPAMSADCIATSCSVPVFTDPMLVECYDGARLPLSIGDVLTQDGDPFAGTVISWESTDVEITGPVGLFTPPDTEISQSYTLGFSWQDDANPDCVFPGSITIQVNIEPDPEINAVDNVCAGTGALISGVEPADPAATASWDWGSGTSADNTGFGPHEVLFADPGTYEVTLTVSSADDCSATAVQDVIIEEPMSAITGQACAGIDPTTVSFSWDAVDGATGYTYTIDGGPEETTTETTVEGTGGSATIPMEITVTAISGNTCPDVTATWTCTPSACPKIDSIVANQPDCVLLETPSFTVYASGGTQPYTYDFGNNPPVMPFTPPEFEITNVGVYELILTDAGGCMDTLDITIDAAPAPEVTINVPSGAILVDETEEISYNLDLDGITVPINSVVWYINGMVFITEGNLSAIEIVADEDFIATYGRDFEVTVEIYFEDDCFIDAMERFSIIDIERWYVPNVISTSISGDDNWQMYTQGNVTVDRVRIYDRWGELVYLKDMDPILDRSDASGPDASGQVWDINWKGNWDSTGNTDKGPTGDVLQGVYVYVIEMTLDAGTDDERPEVEAGDVTVFR